MTVEITNVSSAAVESPEIGFNLGTFAYLSAFDSSPRARAVLLWPDSWQRLEQAASITKGVLAQRSMEGALMGWRRGQAYGQDLRDRVMAASGSLREVATRFAVSESYVATGRPPHFLVCFVRKG